MKKKSTSQSAFFNLRILIASVLCLFAVFVAVVGSGAFSNLLAQTKGPKRAGATGRQDAPGTQTPKVTQMIGPAVINGDLRNLPHVPSGPKISRPLLKPGLHGTRTRTESEETSAFPQFQSLLGKIFRPVPNMPLPLLTFDGISSAESFCGCIPPDTIGDVGPNNYVETTNIAIKIFDKSGNTLLAAVSEDDFFAPLGTTPCGTGLNQGDPFVFYDHVADRWVVSNFAFLSFGGNPSYECIGVSQTSDPVSGGWFLYAVLVDPTNANDYPKAAMWNNPQPGGAYHFTYNMWASLAGPFVGVQVMALDRAAMLAGQQNPTVVSFFIPLAGLTPDVAYSLVPAGFRTGDPPPSDRDEMLLALRSGVSTPATFSDVLGWLFHVDFVNPTNSTLGIGTNHSANAFISVNTYTEAWNASLSDPFAMVPQSGTSVKLDTLGDKIMTPVVYQNRNGTESLWADQTDILNFPNGPTVVSWYQFDVTGGTFPAIPVQQQAWSNGNDGLWRFMPSIAVDQNGNTAIGYSTSSATIFPSIRYAGRLASDPPGNLGQGEAVMFNGIGSQSANRWGDYSMTTIDPTDGMTFWHANEYYSSGWHTRIGKFNFVAGASPTPTPTASPSVTPTPTPSPGACSWSAGADLPSAGIRFSGVFFPANGKFYAMGGRDMNNVEFTHPFEFDPVSNTWTTKGASYPDPFVSNTECAVANDSGTDYIYCVGGSQVSTQTETGRVFRYDPVADVITTVATDWTPGDANTLPGGITVFNNTIFILGGYDVGNAVSTDQIWAFTPNPAGWVQKSTVLPVPLAYIPTTTIGSLIYTGGGLSISGATFLDTTNSFVYDPVADSISTIASIPRATSDTRGINFCNQFYVMGGGGFPTTSNEVDVYDPVSNTWSIGTPFVTARRNSANDTDGTNNIWLAGGLDSNLTALASTEIFNCPMSPCVAPSPTPTPPSRTTPTPRPRPTPAPRP